MFQYNIKFQIPGRVFTSGWLRCPGVIASLRLVRVLVTDLVVVAMAFDACSWLLFAAVLVNQAGRVMIPAIKTSVLVDPDFAPAFEQNVGAMRPEPSPQP